MKITTAINIMDINLTRSDESGLYSGWQDILKIKS